MLHFFLLFCYSILSVIILLLLNIILFTVSIVWPQDINKIKPDEPVAVGYQLHGDKQAKTEKNSIDHCFLLVSILLCMRHKLHHLSTVRLWLPLYEPLIWHTFSDLSQEITVKMEDLYIVNSLAFSMSCGATCLCCKLKAQQQRQHVPDFLWMAPTGNVHPEVSWGGEMSGTCLGFLVTFFKVWCFFSAWNQSVFSS